MSSADRPVSTRDMYAFWFRTRQWGYAVAVFAVGVATVLQFGLFRLGPFHQAFILFYPTVVLATLYGGIGPGILATVLSAISAGYFFVEPRNTFIVRSPEGIIGPLLFTIIGLFLTFLTGRSRAIGEALKRSETDLKRAQGVAQTGSWRHDIRQATLVLSNEACRIMGLAAGTEATREQMIAMLLAEDRTRTREDWAAALKAGIYDAELRVMVKGAVRWLHIQATVERNAEGQAIAAFGTVQEITERKQAEERLQEYERVVESLNEMIVVVDRDYRCIIANRAFLNYRGITRDQVVGRLAREIVDPEVFEKSVKPRLDECFQGKVVQYELKYTYPVLGERDLFISYFPIEGPSGVERVASVMQDVTESRRIAQSLKLFRTLIDHSNDVVEVVDPKTLRFLDVNDKACRELGYSREELLSMTVYDIDPEVDEARRQQVKAGLRSAGFIVTRGVHRRKDGSTFPVELSLRYVRLARDYVVTFARDITDRECAEEALKESVDRYRDLVEHSEDLLCTHDLQGNLLSVNPAPARILGYPVEELLKIPMRDLIVPEGRELFEAYLERLRTTGKPESGLLCVITKSGEVRAWEYYNTLRTEGVEQPIVRGMAHDVTERRRAEVALQESEKRFRFALKDSPVTVFNQDRDLRYTWVYNPPPEWPSDILGKTYDDVLGAKNAERLNELTRKVLETGKGVRTELTFGRNGHQRAFDVSLEPLLNASGAIVGITGSLMDVARLRQLADRLEEQRDKLVREKLYLEGEIQAELGFEEIIGHSPALVEVLKKVRIVAPTSSTVLLLGETGTGKELVARALHALSGRHEKNFIKLNCAAVPSGLLESELFGHEKGAFTSAVSQKVGRLELADGGTLFLDEIGELPPELQPKLLRVLQDREFERLGGVRTLRVDVRIISATNRDLRRDVAAKRFREDLFYRLNVFPVQLPTLRDRKSDIPMLVLHFIRKYATRMGKHIEHVPRETMNVLQSWHWPGNVRELENMIERMVILSQGDTLAAPPVELEAGELAVNKLEDVEREHIMLVLRETLGVLSGPDGAASRLGMKRTTLQSKLKRFGIEPGDYRRVGGMAETQ
jgi:formate hydrogenlyase transcriptional activator